MRKAPSQLLFFALDINGIALALMGPYFIALTIASFFRRIESLHFLGKELKGTLPKVQCLFFWAVMSVIGITYVAWRYNEGRFRFGLRALLVFNLFICCCFALTFASPLLHFLAGCLLLAGSVAIATRKLSIGSGKK